MRLTPLLAALSLTLSGCALVGGDRAAPDPLRAVSERTVTGFTFPESVGCDAAQNVLYVSQFGGEKLNPLGRDGLGYISKVSLEGKVLEQRAFPETMNKPKGLWIQGTRLWTTDIDSAWIFDTRTKKGRRIALPGAQFANDPAVVGGVLYVSDNRGDQLFRVEPADFLDAGVQPKVTTVWSKKDINPNGLWPARDGSLLIVGFLAPDKPRAVFSMGRDGNVKALGDPLGQLDGVHELRDGSLLITDWKSGSLVQWSAKGGMRTLARDFKGPADFCVMGDTAYVPDLVKSELRIVRLGRGS